jgi:hypothetical protein
VGGFLFGEPEQGLVREKQGLVGNADKGEKRSASWGSRPAESQYHLSAGLLVSLSPPLAYLSCSIFCLSSSAFRCHALHTGAAILIVSVAQTFIGCPPVVAASSAASHSSQRAARCVSVRALTS